MEKKKRGVEDLEPEYWSDREQGRRKEILIEIDHFTKEGAVTTYWKGIFRSGTRVLAFIQPLAFCLFFLSLNFNILMVKLIDTEKIW